MILFHRASFVECLLFCLVRSVLGLRLMLAYLYLAISQPYSSRLDWRADSRASARWLDVDNSARSRNEISRIMLVAGYARVGIYYTFRSSAVADDDNIQ